MVYKEQLIDLLPNPDISKQDKILLILGTNDNQPKQPKEILEIGLNYGLRRVKSQDVYNCLNASKGLAAKIAGGWQLTTPGIRHVKNFLPALEQEPPEVREIQTLTALEIFISHSSADAAIAEGLINLLRIAINVPAEKLRCTSVIGYALPAGATIEDQLRSEILAARLFIALITPSSIKSTFVIFEWGGRWAAKLGTIPILAAGATTQDLHGPIRSLNAVESYAPEQIHRIVGDIAQALGQRATNAAVYQRQMETFLNLNEAARLQNSRDA